MSLLPNETLIQLSPQARAHGCPFCTIAADYPPFDPVTQITSPNKDSSGHVVLSTPDVIAFLDILPLTQAHILVCPRKHLEKLSDFSPAENAVVGAWLPIIARAACKVSRCEDFNIVQNNGVNAAQVVPHVHYHIIPRPDERQREELEAKTPEDKKRWWKSPFGSGWRTELDDEDGEQLAAELRLEVQKEVEGLRRDPDRQKDGRFLASL